MSERTPKPDSKKMGRRTFLKFGGAVGAAVTLAATGCSIPGTSQEQEKPKEAEQLSEREQCEKDLRDAVNVDAARIIGYALENEGEFSYEADSEISFLSNKCGDEVTDLARLAKSVAHVAYWPEGNSIYMYIGTGQREGIDDFVQIELDVPDLALPVTGPEGGLNIKNILYTLAGKQGDAKPYSVKSVSVLAGESNWRIENDETGERMVAHKEGAASYGDFTDGTLESVTSENLASALTVLNESMDRLVKS